MTTTKKEISSFYFVRHGESVNNKNKLVNGWTDCDLTENGIRSAYEAGEMLKGYPIKRIITSDLKRAIKTAEIIAKTIGLKGEIETYPELRERNWGIYENKPIENRPGLDISPESGEDWETFFNRVLVKLDNLKLNENTLIVGHAGIMRVIRKWCNTNDVKTRIENTKPVRIINLSKGWIEKDVEKISVTALLALKEHSERVKNKNFRTFVDEPLFYKIIKTLNKCSFVRQVIVNTDSRLIEELLIRDFPTVKIHFRPAYLTGDFVEMDKIIEYDIGFSDSEHFLQTHATNPLLTNQTIDNAISTYFIDLIENDSLFSVNKIKKRLYFPDGRPINHNKNELKRTQDLNAIFERNANIYLFSKVSFSKTKNRIGLNPFMYEMNKIESIDIDEETDFTQAELLYKHINNLQ